MFDKTAKIVYNSLLSKERDERNLQNFEQEMQDLEVEYNFGLKMLETELDILIKEFTREKKYNPVEHTKSRLKSIDSIKKKLIRKNLEITRENAEKNVHDIIGLRIVCTFVSDVYDIVQMIQNSKEIRIIDKKDYIKTPKESGYSSYHLIVLIPVYLASGVKYMEAEIQIRTVTMDFWASLDHKIRYKFLGEIPEEVENQMAKYSQEVKAIDEKMLTLNELVNKYNEKED